MGDMMKALAESFPTFITKESELEFGYIAPGHGARGQQRWIADDIDLQDMYAEYRGKKEITLWFFINKDVAKGKKRAHSPGGGGPSKKPSHQSDVHKAKMEEVEEILKKLKQKHTGSFSEEKIRAWAHLIQMKKHASYDNPPDMPYFKKGNKKAPDNSAPVSAEAGISPCKKLNMRTACIEQLDKWHGLLEKGGITQGQYTQLQEKIMSDMLSM